MNSTETERARSGRARRTPFYEQMARSTNWLLGARALTMLVLFAGIFFISVGFILSLFQSAGTIAAIWGDYPDAAAFTTAEGGLDAPSGRVQDGAGYVPVQLSDAQSLGLAPEIPDTGPAVITSGRIELPTATPLPTQESEALPVETSLPETPPPTPEPTQTPLPSPTPIPPGPPERLVIPVIMLDAPVKPMPLQHVTIQDRVFEQWMAPAEFAAGWQQGSAEIGAPGNTVLNGHHNVHGSVFSHLRELLQGDSILVYSGENVRHYVVSQVMILEERSATLEQRQENARWVLPSNDERLTLVTCWPPESNTHRLIVVAVPGGDQY